MAACGFGIPGLKFTSYSLDGARSKQSRLQNGLMGVQFDGLRLSPGSHKLITACKASSTEADSAAAAAAATTILEESRNETMLSDDSDQTSEFIPNSSEVESLLTMLCDTSTIAEFELKLGKFHLRVTRNLAGQIPPPQPPSPAPVTGHSTEVTPDLNGSVSSPSLALTKPEPSSGGVQLLLNNAVDEGLAILQSPRVGYFRRSRTIKGKRAPPSCKEKDVVKEGQVLCYIEQLGGEVPVESDVSGEVVKILREDGEPVGYGDALIAVLPSFPGIMKLQ